MELRQIEYVVGVVEHGGFTRAATALHVTQPALSEGVARLEAELGVALFHRVGRRAVVSAAGEAFLEPARQLLRDRAVLTTSVAAVVGIEAGRLDLVALPTLAVEPLSPLVGEFRRAHPGVVVHIEQPEEATAITTRVRNGRSELGLAELPVADAGLVSEPLLVQELVVLLPPSSPLVGRRRLTVADLAAVPLVMTPPGTPMRRLIDGAFADAGAAATLAVETEHREALVALVLAGAGASILPAPLADTARAAGAVAVALSPRLRRQVGLVRRRGPVSPAAQAFIDIARVHFARDHH
ncbi:MAG TPA: LysR substrate-binding domain-containing protein [Acidimicrobiia bacterium]|jgi:DNA-binding transcriptional LysR family regulator